MFPVLAAALVFLDPGHSPLAPGAQSARGRLENVFNEEVAQLIDRALASPGGKPAIEVKYTRADREEVALRERAERANRAKAALLLSVHHDSVEEHELSSWDDAGTQRKRSRVANGFSLHVRGDDAKSVAVARQIAKALVAAGFKPTPYHLNHYAAVDVALGIYDRQHLAVLNAAKVPAVLLECGFIINDEEEAMLVRPEVRAKFVAAVAEAVRAAIAPAAPPK